VTTIEILQISGAVIALVLQLFATLLTKPIKQIIPQKLWWTLFGLNLLELIRRVLIMCSVTNILQQSSYELVTVIIGLLVSMTLLAFMWELSKPAKEIERQLERFAQETFARSKACNAKDSLAYKLALHFIKSKRAKPPSAQT
jgi:hypothetical protein